MKLVTSPFDDWERWLAPSAELLRDAKHNRLPWNDYVVRLKSEHPIYETTKRIVDHIDKAYESGRGELVIVRIDEDSEFPKCYTWILLNMVEDATYKFKDEFGKVLEKLL